VNAREKTIAIVLGAVVGLYALDSYLLTPQLDRLSKADASIAEHNQTLSEFDTIKRRRINASKDWRKAAADTVRSDASSAESQLLSRVRDCAQRASLALNSQKTEKAEKEKGYDRVLLKASGTGSMQQISRFLYEVQHASFPVRINDIDITSRKDGTDDLTVSITLATIYQTNAPAKVALSNGQREAL
jgi:Tfp pilus assembly protein PilO